MFFMSSTQMRAIFIETLWQWNNNICKQQIKYCELFPKVWWLFKSNYDILQFIVTIFIKRMLKKTKRKKLMVKSLLLMMTTIPLINGWICLRQTTLQFYVMLFYYYHCFCCCWYRIGFMFMFHKTCNIIRHYWDNPFINWALLADINTEKKVKQEWFELLLECKFS